MVFISASILQNYDFHKISSRTKTLDVPLAGKGYSPQTLALILDLVNITNDINNDDSLNNDTTGEETIKVLKKTKKLLSRISGTHPSSLGLHPVIYFYSATGRYQVTAFLGVIELIKQFEAKNEFKDFSNVRSEFEKFLLKHKKFVNQITLKYGSGLKSYKRLHKLLILILSLLKEGKNESEILDGILNSQDFGYLVPDAIEFDDTTRSEFSTETKSAIYLKDALSKMLECKICHGLIHVNSISIDHIDRKEDGGKGKVDNGQLTHPYCNSTIKN